MLKSAFIVAIGLGVLFATVVFIFSSGKDLGQNHSEVIRRLPAWAVIIAVSVIGVGGAGYLITSAITGDFGFKLS